MTVTRFWGDPSPTTLIGGVDTTPYRNAGPLPWMVFGGVEIANAARVFSYLENRYHPTRNPLGIEDIPAEIIIGGLDGICPALWFDESDLPITFYRPDGTSGADGDPAPWYDGSPESAEFLGVIITSITGLDATTGRSVTSRGAGLGGGMLGLQRQATREINVQATLVATSCPGLDYGLRWLAHTLANDLCDTCASYGLELRTTCPTFDDPNLGLINLFEVGMTVGPKVSTTQPVQCCSLRNVEWTLTAGDPWVYGCTTTCADRTAIGDMDSPGLVSCILDPPHPFGVMGALVEVETGSGGTVGFSLKAWDHAIGSPCFGSVVDSAGDLIEPDGGIANPDFETGTDGWAVAFGTLDRGFGTDFGAVPFAGTYAGRMVAGSTADCQIETTITGLVPGQAYTASFHYRTVGDGSDPWTVTGSVVGIASASSASLVGYQTMAIPFTAVAVTATLLIDVAGVGGEENFPAVYIDEVHAFHEGGQPCVSMHLSGVPADRVVTIDGSRQEVTITAPDGTVTDGLPYVDLVDGSLFAWPEFPGCQEVCVAVQLDGEPADSAITISGRQRMIA